MKRKNTVVLAATGALAGAALAGLFAGSAYATSLTSQGVNAVTRATASGLAGAAAYDTVYGEAGKHGCKGHNECKGQGGCKTGDAGCKGKNTCKGKGGCATDGTTAPAPTH